MSLADKFCKDCRFSKIENGNYWCTNPNTQRPDYVVGGRVNELCSTLRNCADRIPGTHLQCARGGQLWQPKVA